MKNDNVNTYPTNERTQNRYDSGNLPLSNNGKNSSSEPAEPLPESSRPRKDGPGGE